MSDKEETVAPEDFVDPNSGRAAQPGAFASQAAPIETGGEQGAGANVPENDPELPAKSDSDAVPEIEGNDNGEDPGEASEVTDDNVTEEANVPENAPESLATEEELEQHAAEVQEQTDAGQDGADATEDQTEETEGGQTEEAEPEAEAKDYSDVLAGSVPSVEKYINEHPDEKDAVIAAEKQGQGRKGILNL